MAEETVKAKLKDITNNKYVIPIIPDATATEAGVVKVDTALDASSANPVQNKAIKEALDAKQPALTAGDGITIENNVISATASVPDNVVVNTSAVTDALGILGTAMGPGNVVIGKEATDNGALNAIAIGNKASTGGGHHGLAIGYSAKTTAKNAIQLGTGTNPNQWTFQVFNYPLLDAEGKIPAERLQGGGTGGAPTLYWYKHFTTGDTEVETGLDLGSYMLVKVYKNGVLLELSDESGESGAETNDYTIDGTKLIMAHTLHMNDKITLEVY